MDERPLVLLDLDGVLWRFLLGLSVNFRRQEIPATQPEPRRRSWLGDLFDRAYWWPFLWSSPLRRVNDEVAAAVGYHVTELRLIAVTNRPIRLYRATNRLLQIAGLPDLPVLYNDTGLPAAYFKRDEARKRRATLFVEDSLPIANFLVRSGVAALLLDRPYNRGETDRRVRRLGDSGLASFLENMSLTD